MKIRIVSICLTAILLLALRPAAGPAHAAPVLLNPSQLIAEVNALRAAYNLPPYTANAILMGISQAHSEYQASIGEVTHIGPGGSHPKDRAYAAGYGGGATIFLSENIIGGIGMDPATAVNWWTGDAPHLNTMIGANYTDIGAGVATGSDGTIYYTIDAGWVSGAPGPGPSLPGNPSGAIPVQAASPNPDGSIVHVVQQGQALYTIAVIYGISLDELLALNDLTATSFIYPGDELLIRAANTATPTPAISETPTLTPTVHTPTPSRTPRAFGTPTPYRVAQSLGTPGEGAAGGQTAGDSPAVDLRYALVGLIALALALAGLGAWRDRGRRGDQRL